MAPQRRLGGKAQDHGQARQRGPPDPGCLNEPPTDAGWLAHPTPVTRQILERQDGRPYWSATPTAERSSARRDPSRRGGAGLHRRLRPDKGESVDTVIADPPPGAPVPQSCCSSTASCSSTATSSR